MSIYSLIIFKKGFSFKDIVSGIVFRTFISFFSMIISGFEDSSPSKVSNLFWSNRPIPNLAENTLIIIHL